MIYLGKDGTVDGQRPKQLNQTFPDDRVVVGVTKLNLKRGCEKRCEPAASAAYAMTLVNWLKFLDVLSCSSRCWDLLT
jgi:hypothetical protein